VIAWVTDRKEGKRQRGYSDVQSNLIGSSVSGYGQGRGMPLVFRLAVMFEAPQRSRTTFTGCTGAVAEWRLRNGAWLPVQ